MQGVLPPNSFSLMSQLPVLLTFTLIKQSIFVQSSNIYEAPFTTGQHINSSNGIAFVLQRWWLGHPMRRKTLMSHPGGPLEHILRGACPPTRLDSPPAWCWQGLECSGCSNVLIWTMWNLTYHEKRRKKKTAGPRGWSLENMAATVSYSRPGCSPLGVHRFFTSLNNLKIIQVTTAMAYIWNI